MKRRALEDESPAVRRAALKRITDQQFLFRVALEDKLPSVRDAATAQLTDPDLLAKIVTEYSPEGWNARFIAVRRINDQAVLERLVRNDQVPPEVASLAVSRLANQALIRELATTSSPVRVAAIGQLTDQTVLAQLALNEEHAWLRRTAAEKLTDQATLAQLALHDADGSVRQAAVDNLTDQAYW